MKIVCFVLLALVAQISAQACPPWPACPKSTKAPKAPASAKYYRVIKPTKHEVAECYNFKLSTVGANIKMEQSMSVQISNVVMNSTYIGSPNPNGNWNMTLTSNGKRNKLELFKMRLIKLGFSGALVSETNFGPISASLAVFNCGRFKDGYPVTGIYSTSKKLSTTEYAAVVKELAKSGVTEKMILNVDNTKCTN